MKNLTDNKNKFHVIRRYVVAIALQYGKYFRVSRITYENL